MLRVIVLAIVSAFLSAVLSSSCEAAASKLVNERILVIHSVPAKNETDSEKRARASAYDGLVEQLTDKGYRVVDRASAEQCSIQIAATHDIDASLNRAAAYGLKFFSEYTIYFRTSTITKEHEDSRGALVRISSRIIDNTSSQILTSKNAEASSGGLTVEDAIDKASRAAGKKLGTLLISAMEKNLSSVREAGRIYTVVLENPAGSSDLLGFLTVLEGNPVIISARETESGGGKATFEIGYRGKRDQLDRDLVRAAAELGWTMEKVRSEGNRSTWKIH